MKLPDSPRNPNVCVCVGLCVCMKTRKKTLDCKHQPEGLRSLLAWQHAEWMAVCVCLCACMQERGWVEQVDCGRGRKSVLIQCT